MSGTLSVPIFKPLLQLSVFTYMHRRQLFFQLFQIGNKSFIRVQYFSSLNGVAKQIVYHLIIHGHPTKNSRILFATTIIGIRKQSRMILRRIGG